MITKNHKRLFKCIPVKPIYRKHLRIYLYGEYDILISDRKLRIMVHELIVSGYPVLTTQYGYCRNTKKNFKFAKIARAERYSRMSKLSAEIAAIEKTTRIVNGQKLITRSGE